MSFQTYIQYFEPLFSSTPYRCYDSGDRRCQKKAVKAGFLQEDIDQCKYWPMTRLLWNNALCNKGWHFWKGGFVTDKKGLKIFVFYKCYDIFFHNFCDKHPLMRKNASKVWKKYSPNISPCFLDAAGGQISDSWFYFHFPLLFHLLQAQLTPFSFIWNICMQKNDGQGWNFHLKYLDVEKMRGKVRNP